MNTEAAKKLWQSMAARFSEMEIPTAADDFTMKIITENEMCRPGQRVLDVGCGAGRYAIALDKLGMQVTATDFSEDMLAAAKNCAAAHQTKNITFSCDDWLHMDIREKGWENQFDLVLCNMTPAIRDEDSLQKAIAACKGWLMITKPCRRTNSIQDELLKRLNLKNSFVNSDRQIKLAFDFLWQMGKNPQMRCEKDNWENKRTLAEAIKYYSLFIENSEGSLTDSQKQQMTEYLTEVAVGGMIIDKTDTVSYALYCWMV